MQASYADLIHEHESIEQQADLLLTRTDRPAIAAETLAQQLHALATAVREHIATEAVIVDLCDARPLPLLWRAAFIDGRDDFYRLCRDWLDYLGRWSAASISADRARFAAETQQMVERLKGRLALETRGLYAVALQTGAITFR